MPDLLIRDLNRQSLKNLKARAKRNRRSLQAEAKLLLEEVAGRETVAALLAKWKERFAGRRFSSSVRMIRADRSR